MDLRWPCDVASMDPSGEQEMNDLDQKHRHQYAVASKGELRLHLGFVASMGDTCWQSGSCWMVASRGQVDNHQRRPALNLATSAGLAPP